MSLSHVAAGSRPSDSSQADEVRRLVDQIRRILTAIWTGLPERKYRVRHFETVASRFEESRAWAGQEFSRGLERVCAGRRKAKEALAKEGTIERKLQGFKLEQLETIRFYFICMLGHPLIEARFIELLNPNNDEDRRALGNKLVRSDLSVLREAALARMGQIAPRKVKKELKLVLGRFEDQAPEVRIGVLRFVSGFGLKGRRVRQVLAKAIRDKETEVRLVAYPLVLERANKLRDHDEFRRALHAITANKSSLSDRERELLAKVVSAFRLD